MNESTVQTTKEFVFQRLSEPFPFTDPKTTPATLAGMVAAVLLLFALLSFVLPLVRTLRGVVAGVAVRGLVWASLAFLGVVVWQGLANAVEGEDPTGVRDQLFLGMVVGEVLLALLFGISTLLTVLSRDRLTKGGNTEGVAFGTLLTVLFGRVDTSGRSWWHYFTGGARAMLFLIPLFCLGISWGFETDSEPVWWFFLTGTLSSVWVLTLDMYVKDSGVVRFWGSRMLFGPMLAWALTIIVGVITVVVLPADYRIVGMIVTGVLVGVQILLLLVGGLLWLLGTIRRGDVGAWAKVFPLALLRCLTFAVLGFCFLLPAMQPWETTEKRSKVVVLLDVSPSMTDWSDDISRNRNAVKKTRMDTVLDFLTSTEGEFVAKLLEKNPVTVYRFGASLDPDPATIPVAASEGDSTNWSRDEWVAFVNYDFKAWVLRYTAPDGTGFSEQAKTAFTDAVAWGSNPGDSQWALDWSKADEATSGADSLADKGADDPDAARKAVDRKLLAAVREKVNRRVDMARLIAQGSAVPDSATAALNREQANMTQAVIVFSDGRSNMSSDQAAAETARRAKEANIPVYTVAVGSAREKVELRVYEPQSPESTQPDEPTQVTVAVDGVGFREGDQVDAVLQLFLPGRDPKTDPPDHEMTQKVTFGPGETPHGETTFVLDAEEFAKKAVTSLIEEISPPKPGRNWQLKKGEWAIRAKVPVDPREATDEPVHLSPLRAMSVIDKPLRVLLAAGAPTREYQILRTLLVREVEQKRAELSIYLQNDGGQKGTIVQDVPPGRLLLKFPDELVVDKDTSVGGGGDPGSDAETERLRAKYNNLNEYDVIICFDPNWNEKDNSDAFRIPDAAFDKLKTWSQNYGGGLVYVAGPFFTAQLVRSNEEGGRLRPLLDLLPVVPDDIVASDDPLLRINGRTTPRRLKLNPPKDSDLLRLDDFTAQRDEAAKAVAGWEQFFTGQDESPKKTETEYLKPKRGFYTYYPVKRVKPLATLLGEFLNVDENQQEAPRPFYAVGPSGAGRTAWLGSGEIYRMRAVPEVGVQFYDKFWLQLARYCSAKRTSKANSRGEVLMSKEVIAGTPIRVRTRVLQSSGEPYPENDLDNPKLTIDKLDMNGEVLDRFGPYDVLKPAKLGTKFEGYYQGVVMPDPKKMTPGEFQYRVNVVKSDLPTPLSATFSLRAANAELDVTAPDLQALRDMASPMKAALELEQDKDKRTELIARLGVTEDDVATGKAKLAFALDGREKLSVIPEMIRTRKESPQNRGVIDPLWDDAYDPAADDRTGQLRFELFGTQLTNTWRFALRLWVPVVLVIGLFIALTWVLRTRADLPKSGVGGVVEGVATAGIGLVFIPLGFAFCLPPTLSLYELVVGEIPTLVQSLLLAACAVPGIGLVGVYAFAGKYRPAVGSVLLTLAMLAQALTVALAIWYGNPFPIGYAVLGLAALLCAEWTLRKLIRLA